MTVSIIILGALVVVGVVLYLDERRRRARGGAEDPTPITPGGGAEAPTPNTPGGGAEAPTPNVCCGLHEVCEKDYDRIVYYDDEELDCYAGREADGYSSSEVDEFRDVLLSMKPTDIPGWARSLQMRQIAMPADVRDEMLLLLSEI